MSSVFRASEARARGWLRSSFARMSNIFAAARCPRRVYNFQCCKVFNMCGTLILRTSFLCKYKGFLFFFSTVTKTPRWMHSSNIDVRWREMFLDSALMVCKGEKILSLGTRTGWPEKRCLGSFCFIVCTTTHHAFSVHLEVLFNKVTTVHVKNFGPLSLFTYVFTHATGC